jgi:hypothetical protein
LAEQPQREPATVKQARLADHYRDGDPWVLPEQFI